MSTLKTSISVLALAATLTISFAPSICLADETPVNNGAAGGAQAIVDRKNHEAPQYEKLDREREQAQANARRSAGGTTTSSTTGSTTGGSTTGGTGSTGGTTGFLPTPAPKPEEPGWVEKCWDAACTAAKWVVAPGAAIVEKIKDAVDPKEDEAAEQKAHNDRVHKEAEERRKSEPKTTDQKTSDQKTTDQKVPDHTASQGKSTGSTSTETKAVAPKTLAPQTLEHKTVEKTVAPAAEMHRTALSFTPGETKVKVAAVPQISAPSEAHIATVHPTVNVVRPAINVPHPAVAVAPVIRTPTIRVPVIAIRH